MAESICHSAPSEVAAGYASIAKAHLAANDLEPAAEAASKALRHDPECAAANGAVGLIADAQGNATEARTYLRRAQQLSPYEPQTNLDLARFLLKEGDRKQAELYLNRALQFAPQHPAATELLRQVSERQAKRGPDE
jgi:Flp pilus assembly protein TadD